MWLPQAVALPADCPQARFWPAAEGGADSFRIVYSQGRIPTMPNWDFRIFDNPGLTVAQVLGISCFPNPGESSGGRLRSAVGFPYFDCRHRLAALDSDFL
jgi:hypothetical protein